jgi:tellurite resistance protein
MLFVFPLEGNPYFYLILGFIFFSSVWTAYDSLKNKIATDSSNYNPISNGSLPWFGACLLFWFFAFPAYIYVRTKTLKARNQDSNKNIVILDENPLESPQKRIVSNDSFDSCLKPMRVFAKIGKESINYSYVKGKEEISFNGEFSEAAVAAKKRYSLKFFIQQLLISLPIVILLWFTTSSVVLSITTLLLSIITLRSNSLRIEIEYVFDNISSEKFSNFVLRCKKSQASKKLWEITHSKAIANEDKKYSGGAEITIGRRPAKLELSRPKRITIKPGVFPSLKLQSETIYFLPDRIFVEGGSCKEYGYSDLSISTSCSKFHESEILPDDALVIGKTWKYVNNNGLPDKRFNNNSEIPLCKYEHVHLFFIDSYFEIMLSQPGTGVILSDAILIYKNELPLLSCNTTNDLTASFSKTDLIDIIHCALYMISADGITDRKEAEILLEFIVNKLPSLSETEIRGFLADVVNTHETSYRSNFEKFAESASKLRLNEGQKQEVITLLQAIMMVDGVSKPEEQRLLHSFVSHLNKSEH